MTSVSIKAVMALACAGIILPTFTSAQDATVMCKDCPFPMITAAAPLQSKDPDVPIPLNATAPDIPFPLSPPFEGLAIPLWHPTTLYALDRFSPDIGSDLTPAQAENSERVPQDAETESNGDSGNIDVMPTMAEAEIASPVSQVAVCSLVFPMPALAVIAVGEFGGGEWSEAALSPREYIEPPKDGIYEMDLVAQRIGGTAEMLNLSYRYAVSIYPQVPENLRGVRITGKSNSLEVPLPARGECLVEASP